MIQNPLDAVSVRLLRLFEAVYRTRSISQAADALRTSQPSVSVSLNRLRQIFDDALFVRVGARMEPTPRADELIEGIRAMLLIAGDHFVRNAPFDPARSDRRFVLHMTDPGEAVLIPRLAGRIADAAPAVRLLVRRIGDDSQTMLANGEVDLVLGYLAREAEGLRQRKLHDEHYVCIARADHPRIGATLGVEQFRSESHVVAAIAGSGHTHVEPGFGRMRIEGRVVLEVSSYIAAAATVARTDLIAVVPSRLADELVELGSIRAFKLPMEGPAYQVRQYWHPRSDHDAGHRWMRDLIVAVVSVYKPSARRESGGHPGSDGQARRL